jgi:hypothetical protein
MALRGDAEEVMRATKGVEECWAKASAAAA